MKSFYAKNIFLSVLLLMAAVLGGWLAHSSLTLDHPAANLPTTPDGFMHTVTYHDFNVEGQLENQFQADHLIHYYSKDSATFDNPKLTSNSDKLTWVITADHGSSNDGNAVIYLEGHVRITRFEKASQKTSALTTTNLTLYPKRKYTETTAPVTITQPGTVMQGVGFSADLNSGQMKLWSNTHGTYIKQ